MGQGSIGSGLVGAAFAVLVGCGGSGAALNPDANGGTAAQRSRDAGASIVYDAGAAREVVPVRVGHGPGWTGGDGGVSAVCGPAGAGCNPLDHPRSCSLCDGALSGLVCRCVPSGGSGIWRCVSLEGGCPLD